MRKLTKAIFVLSLALMVALTGCKTGMFAPRTGELFPGLCAGVFGAPLGLGIWGAQKSGYEWMIVFVVPGLPLAAVGFVADVCVISPLVDIVCLPYDLCQPYHGCYLRIVDEDGRPVQGATPRYTVTLIWAGMFSLGRQTPPASSRSTVCTM